jgi:DNA-binding LacI/PurR family transcriptional regulator
MAGGEDACEALLDLPDPPSAIFAESDEMAAGAWRALKRHGLRVPDDVALIGFDDHPTARLIDLSTVRQPVTEQAVDIATRLFTALDGSAEPANGADPVQRPADDVVLATELVIRGSTDPARSIY